MSIELVRFVPAAEVSRPHRGARSQGVLVDLPSLHDHDKILRGVLDQLDAGNRIAVDEDEFTEESRLDSSALGPTASRRLAFG
jgi:hypothetical protein